MPRIDHPVEGDGRWPAALLRRDEDAPSNDRGNRLLSTGRGDLWRPGQPIVGLPGGSRRSWRCTS